MIKLTFLAITMSSLRCRHFRTTPPLPEPSSPSTLNASSLSSPICSRKSRNLWILAFCSSVQSVESICFLSFSVESLLPATPPPVWSTNRLVSVVVVVVVVVVWVFIGAGFAPNPPPLVSVSCFSVFELAFVILDGEIAVATADGDTAAVAAVVADVLIWSGGGGRLDDTLCDLLSFYG